MQFFIRTALPCWQRAAHGGAQPTSLVEQDAKKRGEAWSGPDYLASVVPPVLNALVDADARVRYYACEALYNIAKARLNPPCFKTVFLKTS